MSALIHELEKIEESLFVNKGELEIPMHVFATALGLRQQSQIAKLSKPRATMAYWLLSNMSDSVFQRQLNYGAEFVCGYRPGIIPSEEGFNALAEQTRLSDKSKSAAKKVLVEGLTLLDASKVTEIPSQTINQSCLSICRLGATIEAARKSAAKGALANSKEAVKTLRPTLLLALIANDTESNILGYVSGELTPTFNQAAFFSIIAHSSMETLRKLEVAFLSYMEELEEIRHAFDCRYRRLWELIGVKFESYPVYFKSSPSDVSIHTPPSLMDLNSLVLKARKALKLSPAKIRERSLKNGMARGSFHMGKLHEMVKNGQTLTEAINRYYPNETYSNVYRRYKAWVKKSPHPYWI